MPRRWEAAVGLAVRHYGAKPESPRHGWQVSNRIIHEVRGLNPAVYDILGKPPARFERMFDERLALAAFARWMRESP
ncbi:hypothetical protein [Pseudoduganella buxea]|uniref:Uncharacterized protein n=1 Tax=Pseudoduganella buxea TaxID=1949069 RepID=A0ABQ1KWE0_9BURK|nr:hypothetical protein [Pseudoduganella buxea]GGC13074.1 hypothetical protein GCM10011572_38090 [Pseudoduganella buxea]